MVAVHRGQQETRHDELVTRIAAAAPSDGSFEVLPGVRFNRDSQATDIGHDTSKPVLCLIGQGSKEWILGETIHVYSPGEYLIATAELPVGTRVVNASPSAPYLGVVITLDPEMVRSVLVEAGHVPNRQCTSAVHVSPLDPGLLEAVLRLVRLAENPDMAGFLGPLAKREIIYRLLMGQQGDRLRHVAGMQGPDHRIVEAIQRMRTRFDQHMRIEDEARELGMSLSTFHAHFRAVTEMSPLEFLKQLRLQEARRLMVGEGMDASGAGARVGYRDPSQFSREYKRLFGAPPARDVALQRQRVQPG